MYYIEHNVYPYTLIIESILNVMCINIVSYIVSWILLSFNVFCFLKIIPFDYVHNPCSTLATHRSICAPNGISVQACRTCARQPHAYFSQSTLCAPASHKGCSA